MRESSVGSRLWLIIVSCCFLPFALQGQEAATATCYDKAETQFELNSCAGEEYTRADTELNRVYKVILEKYKDDPKFIAKFREASELG